MISILSDHEVFAPCFLSLDMFQCHSVGKESACNAGDPGSIPGLICSSVSWFIVYGKLNRICILLLCENCINLNYVELVHSAFQVYYILLLFCISILLIFENFILKLELKILIYLKSHCNT